MYIYKVFKLQKYRNPFYEQLIKYISYKYDIITFIFENHFNMCAIMYFKSNVLHS